MSRGRHAKPVRLTKKDRQELELLVGRRTAPSREVTRARIALMADEGQANTAIAQELGVSVQTVCAWRQRVARQGASGVWDMERGGRPPRITPKARLKLIELARKPQKAGGERPPTLDDIAADAVAQGIVGKISRSHVHRILRAEGLRPRRVQKWLSSPDATFRETVNVICDMYRKAPRNAVVVSVSEKSGIQAIEHRHRRGALLARSSQRSKREYVRHGTQTLFAALNVHTGQVIASCLEQRTQDDLMALLENVAAAYPGRQVHVIWDNLNTQHARALWQAFNARHGGRFHFYRPPLHSSWLNQVELWFALYTRRVLNNASHTSVAHLRECTEQFIREQNRLARPFKWAFRGFRSGPAHHEADIPGLSLRDCAVELNRQLCRLLAHKYVATGTYGRHILIKRWGYPVCLPAVARLTPAGHDHYVAAFRNHSGRWEPLPGSGPLDAMAERVATLLQPYLEPDTI
nr:IS630 family transposase [Burkholderia sp. A9]